VQAAEQMGWGGTALTAGQSPSLKMRQMDEGEVPAKYCAITRRLNGGVTGCVGFRRGLRRQANAAIARCFSGLYPAGRKA